MEKKTILIRNGRVIDPSRGADRVTDIRIQDGRIAAWDVTETPEEGTEVIDATGLIVTPGLIDMHVHLREPGREEDETIETGTAAAIRGGFTSVACMPNTEPPLDTQAGIEFVRHQALRADHCNVYCVGCVTKNRAGEELAEIGMLCDSGAVAFSDDGAPVHNAELMRQAFEYCRMFDRPVLNHAEIPELTRGGVMHEGLVSMKLGLQGMPAEAEIAMVSRDIALAEATGGRLHIMHVSTKDAIDSVRRARARGVRVTAEVTPHHFTLTDEELVSFDSNYKMNPPLRPEEHRLACIEGLRDGTIDCIATDHAPHAIEKKQREIDLAPFGIVGLETALGLVITKLIRPGLLDWSSAIAKMTINPAEILGIPKGTLAVGADADVTLIDPEVRWTVDPSEFVSRGRNTPFGGMELIGRAVKVIVGGRVRN
ncbi:MAG: dihydroorotase [Planctomycetia bacterium]|nr:dihydroorotase [Planctomycetia bacterium]